MVIKVLAENTAISDEFRAEHGLSLYIETGSRKLLFDMGESDVFLYNAKKLGVNLSDIDFAVISHGHSDHGGGLDVFLKENKRAPIYVHPKAFEKYYAQNPDGRQETIGLNSALKDSARFIFTSERFFIQKGMELFSNPPGTDYLPSSNQTLMMERNEEMVRDDFAHEQNLIISEEENTVLFSGCAHRGIVNIVNRFYELKNRYADCVIGGFHLYSVSGKTSEDPEIVKKIAQELKKANTKYYTCHCTGIKSYNLLKEEMGEQIGYLASGSVLNI